MPQKGCALSHSTMTPRVSIFTFHELGSPPPPQTSLYPPPPHPTLLTQHCHQYTNKSRTTKQRIMDYINIKLTRTHAEQKWFKYTGTWQLRRRERKSVAVKTKYKTLDKVSTSNVHMSSFEFRIKYDHESRHTTSRSSSSSQKDKSLVAVRHSVDDKPNGCTCNVVTRHVVVNLLLRRSNKH